MTKKMTMMRRAAVATGVLAMALPAAAHPGHGADSGFVNGLLHPVTGVDHLLALLAVGLWSRQQRHGVVLAPTFLVLMALGAASAGSRIVVPALELSIAASVLLLGVLAACAPALQRRVPPELAVITVGACAFLHGLAHGNELSGELGGMSSGAGFILASALVMLAGAMPVERLRRALGAAIGAAGVWLVALAA
ncbi:HupE/UreJ family protein [Massilia sp. YIM B02443]|uniref:HupE/UreJ family protein n=1 Tax=Massilia sp. YIM B02443 TaxID=3050127 RepID=UPI0025B72422|nr:HupE/UreJ family protein [Massilia sp. YIM B02443]MDN4039783.1 HupE/UreJ family protein [Massilia sp. YIM B02443]